MVEHTANIVRPLLGKFQEFVSRLLTGALYPDFQTLFIANHGKDFPEVRGEVVPRVFFRVGTTRGGDQNQGLATRYGALRVLQEVDAYREEKQDFILI